MAGGFFVNSNTYSAQGGTEGFFKHITVDKAGTYTITYEYEHYTVPDTFTLRANGKTLYSSGVTGGAGHGTVKVKLAAGGGFDLVSIGNVQPSTLWTDQITWERTDGKPEARPDRVKLDGEKPLRIKVLQNDKEHDAPLDPASVKIDKLPLHGRVTVNADGTIIYIPKDGAEGGDSFTYTVKDKNGNVSNSGAVRITGDCPDIFPLTVDADIIKHHSSLLGGETCIALSTATVGRADGNPSMLRVENGRVEMLEGKIKIHGDVIATFAGGDRALFTGDADVTARTGASESLTAQVDPLKTFNVGGLMFLPSAISLEANKLLINGGFTLPLYIGGQALNLAPGINAIYLDDTGAGLQSGSYSLPTATFNIFNKFSVNATGVKVAYDGAQNSLKINGTYEVALPWWKTSGGGNTFTMNLADPNFLEIKDGQVNAQVKFSLKEISVANVFTISDATLGLTIVNSQAPTAFSADAKIKLDFLKKMDFGIQAGLEFTSDPVNGYGLERVTIGVVDVNRPVYGPIHLQDLSGTLAGVFPNSHNDAILSGSARFTLGPSIDEIQVQLPEWFAPGDNPEAFTLFSLRGDLEFRTSVTTGETTTTASLTSYIIKEKLATGTNAWTINWTKGVATASGSINLLNGIFEGTDSLTLDLGSGTLSGSATGTFRLPYNTPLVNAPIVGRFFAENQGREFGGARAKFTVSADDDLTNDVISIAASASIGTFGTITFGLTAGFATNDFGSLFLKPVYGAAAQALVGSWDTTAGQPWLLMQAHWQNAQDVSGGPVPFYVTFRPAGSTDVTFINPEDFDANGIEILPDFSGPLSAGIIVSNPAEGRWDIVPANAAPLGDITYDGWGQNEAPSLVFGGANFQPESLRFTYQGSDPDGAATVQYFLDPDGRDVETGTNTGTADANGYAISGKLALNGGLETFEFNPHLAPDGNFDIYALIEEANGVQTVIYHPDTFNGAAAALDLSISVSGLPQNARPGEVFTYQVTITNQSQVWAAIGAELRETLGSNLTLVSISSSDGGYQPDPSSDPSRFRWEVMQQGESVVANVTVRANPGGASTEGISGNLIITHDVTSSSIEHDRSDNHLVTVLGIDTAPAPGAAADLKVERIPLAGHEDDNGVALYTLRVTNLGTEAVTGAHLIEEVVSGTGRIRHGNFNQFFVSETLEWSAITRTDERVDLTLTRIGPGAFIDVPIRAASVDGGALTLQASLTIDPDDPDPTNNAVTAVYEPGIPVANQYGSFNFRNQPGGAFGNNTFEASTGGSNIYGVTVPFDIFGPDLYTDIDFRLTLPEGLTFHSTSWPSAEVAPDGRSVILRSQFPDGNERAFEGNPFSPYSIYFLVTNETPGQKTALLELQNLSAQGANTLDNHNPADQDAVLIRVGGAAAQAPVFAGSGALPEARQGEAYSYTLPADFATDPQGQTLTYTVSAYTGNDWFTFDPATRTISGTPRPSDQDAYFYILATDTDGNSFRKQFSIPVVDTQQMPEISRPYDPVTAFAGELFEFRSLPESYRGPFAYFTDPDQTGPQGLPFPDFSTLPAWLTYDPANNLWSGTPQASDIGEHTITVLMANLLANGTADAYVNQPFVIKVIPIEAPVAVGPQSFSGTQNEALIAPLPANAFVDPNGDTLSVWVTGLPSWLSFDPESLTFTGTPGQGAVGSITVDVHAADGKRGYAAVPVTFTIANADDAPAAGADLYEALAGQTLTIAAAQGVLVNDIDIDGDAKAAALVSGPAHGTLNLAADGGFSYTPAAGFSGEDTFVYRVTANGQSADELVTIRTGNPPAGAPDTYAALANRMIVISAAQGVLANDTDADVGPLTAALRSSPAHGKLSFSADGGFVYKADAGYSGADTFTYAATDGVFDTAPVTVTLNVQGVNRAPTDPGKGTGPNWDQYLGDFNTPGQPLVITAAQGVLSDEADLDGNALQALLTRGAHYGTVALAADGGFSYTPFAGLEGRGGVSDSFYYRALDGTSAGAEVLVTFFWRGTSTAGADVIARDDRYATAANTALTVDFRTGLLANDTDPQDALFPDYTNSNALFLDTFFGNGLNYLVSGPSHGALTNVASDGDFVYTPDAGFTGIDSFQYRTSRYGPDTAGAHTTATVYIAVGTAHAPNLAPVANNDSYTVAEDSSLVVTGAGVLANDTDPEGAALFAARVITGPTRGFVQLNNAGNFFYRPWDGYSGPDSFKYRAWDGEKFSDATVSITVTPVIDRPIVQSSVVNYIENSASNQLTGSVFGFATVDGTRQIASVDGSAALVGQWVDFAFGRVKIDAAGAYTLDVSDDNPAFENPALFNAAGAHEHAISLVAANEAGLGSAFTYSFSLRGAPDKALAKNDAYTAYAGETLVVDGIDGVLENDRTPGSDPVVDSVSLFEPAGLATRGTVTWAFDSSVQFVQDVGFVRTWASNGSFLFTPDAGFTGTTGFSYTLLTGGTADVTINVLGAGTDGTADPDSIAGGAGADYIRGLASGDTLWGAGGRDTLRGGEGGDTLYGGTDGDALFGDGGDDVIYAESDDLSVSGGGGYDYLLATDAGGVTFDLAASEIEWALGYTGDDVFDGAGANVSMYIRGGAGDDTIIGGSVKDWLYGGADDDLIEAGDGDDTVDGGDGADSLSGGAGGDVLYVDIDDVFFDGGDGRDYLVATGSGSFRFDLADANVEWARGGAEADYLNASGAAGALIELYGLAGNDTLAGGDGGSYLSGGAGQDRLAGGTGREYFLGGSEADTFVFALNGGRDDVLDFEDGIDRFDVTALAAAGVRGFSDLAIDSTYSAGGWVGVGYSGGKFWVKNGFGFVDAGDFIFA